MSKKLLIAVLTLGLLFTYCGAVLGSDNPGNIQRTPLPTSNPNAPLLNAPTALNQVFFEKPPEEPMFPAEATLFPPPYYCQFIDYSGGNAAYFFNVPTDPIIDPTSDAWDLYHMRFTAEKGYACTLLTAWIGTYEAGFVGTPDLVVKVWDDDGFGLPGTEVASVTVPYASIAGIGFDYLGVPMPAPLIFEDEENYFVGVTVADKVNTAYALLGDDGTAGVGRSGVYINDAGIFINRADAGLTDFNFLIGVDVCCYDLPYSSCERVEYDCGAAFYFDPAGYGQTTFPLAARYETSGPDTLVAVGVAVYGGGSFGTDDLDVYVWGDNAGFPDLSNVMHQTTIPNASINYYFATGWNHVPVGMVMPYGSAFHVGFDAVAGGGATQHAPLMDDGLCGALASTCLFGGSWYNTIDLFGLDHNWLIYADICKDEFSVCFTQSWAENITYVWNLPSDGSTRTGYYQKFSPTGIGCRLEEVRHYFYDWGEPNVFAEDMGCWVYPDVGGVPGTTPLAQVIIPTTDMVLFPAPTVVDFTPYNVLFDEPVWVGVEKYHTAPPGIVTMLSDDGFGVPNQGAVHYIDDAPTPDEWLILSDLGGGWDHNWVMDADICCIPPEERPCVPDLAPDPNWPTCGHDFRRTSASDNPTPNAKCTQSLLWSHNDPQGFLYNRPIIYDGVLLVAYNSKMQAFDIATGPPALWTVGSIPYMSSTFRNSVTAKDGYVYFGGGNAQSFNKNDVYLGTSIWSRNVVNQPLVGITDYTTSVILDCGGTEVVFFCTADGNLYALETATGNNFGGWSPNPVNIGGNPWHTLSSNGVDKLYIGHDGGGGEGAIMCIDACTGAVDWELTYPDLAGDDIGAVDPPAEWFRGPLAVDDDGSIYAITAVYNFDTPGVPNGIRYKFSPSGSIIWAKPGYYTYYTGPVLDANYVYYKSWRGWTSDPLNNLTALSKNSGGTIWTSDPMYNSVGLVEGALSCEPLAADLLYTTNNDAQLLALNADDGLSEFEYNYVGTNSAQGCGVAIDPDYMVFTTRQGDIYVFTSGAKADRPRLRILKFDELQPVPFFSPPSHPVTFEDVFMNNGCANLTGALTVNETPQNPAAVVWSVDPDRIARLQDAANSMIDNSFEALAGKLVKGQRIADDIETMETSPYVKDSYSNMAAYGPPAWLNAVTTPTFDLIPGEVFDVIYDVNGPLVTRGPHYAYVTIASNDNYYLNATYDPEIQLGVLGGCLQVDDVMYFGVGEANQGPVFNTGEIGNQSGAEPWIFDGEDDRYWQGGLFFATAEHELAWTTDSWHGADPEDFWASLLPDPNCFDQCEPYITPDPIILGAIWDGSQYVNIQGYASVAAYVDSVIDFDCYGTGWSWDNVACPFDNDLTIGIHVQEYMYGAIDVPELNNVVIYRYDVTNRNADPITGMGVSVFHDYDLDGSLNGFDAFKYSDEYGIAYGSPCSPAYPFTAGVVYGTGTIPMDIMRNAHTLDANQAMWEDNYVWLDSCYYYMANVTGQTAQAGVDINFPCDPESESDDRDLWATFLLTDLGGNESMTFGTYFFGYASNDVTDDQFYYDLATLVNQFAGFDRGDICGVDGIDLADVVHLLNIVLGIPDACDPPLFASMADVNGDGVVNMADYEYLRAYYFCAGPPPEGGWALPDICP